METYAMEVSELPVSAIRVGPRRRPVDANVVRDIAKSIERQGLLQPIGVKALPEDIERKVSNPILWEVVFGAHRMAAYTILKYESIEARILPSGLKEEEYLLIELQENSARNDLTTAQRRAYAGEIGTISAKLWPESNSATGRAGWLKKFAEQSNVPLRTMESWWKAFCEATGIALLSGDALDVDKNAFFAWLKSHQEREEAEKKRKEDEAAAARQRQELEDALENLFTLARDYGRETVIREVIDIFLADEST